MAWISSFISRCPTLRNCVSCCIISIRESKRHNRWTSMGANQPPPNAQEIGGVLGRVNRLGTATERMFSRLYRGINRKSALQAESQRSEERRVGKECESRWA